jgi:hypothetical protein
MSAGDEDIVVKSVAVTVHRTEGRSRMQRGHPRKGKACRVANTMWFSVLEVGEVEVVSCVEKELGRFDGDR